MDFGKKEGDVMGVIEGRPASETRADPMPAGSRVGWGFDSMNGKEFRGDRTYG
jgi:hypothetical protein